MESIDLKAASGQDKIFTFMLEQSKEMSSLKTSVLNLKTKVEKQGKKIRHQEKDLAEARRQILTLQEDCQMKNVRVNQLEQSMESVKGTITKHGRFSAFFNWSKVKKGVVTEIDDALHPGNIKEMEFSTSYIGLASIKPML